MPAIVKLTTSIAARSSVVYKAQLVAEDGTPLPATDIAILTLSLRDSMTREIINGLDNTDILNVGRGTLDAEGNLTVILGTDDTVPLGDPPVAGFQYRSMVLNWVGTNGTTVGWHQVDFTITILADY